MQLRIKIRINKEVLQVTEKTSLQLTSEEMLKFAMNYEATNI